MWAVERHESQTTPTADAAPVHPASGKKEFAHRSRQTPVPPNRRKAITAPAGGGGGEICRQ